MSADTTKGGSTERGRQIAVSMMDRAEAVYRHNLGQPHVRGHCETCAEEHWAARLRPVHYREAARSLRVLLDGLLPIDDRTMGIRYAATCLERTAQDLEGERSR